MTQWFGTSVQLKENMLYAFLNGRTLDNEGTGKESNMEDEV